MLDGNSGHVAHAWRKIGLFGGKYAICACSRTNQITETASCVHTIISE